MLPTMTLQPGDFVVVTQFDPETNALAVTPQADIEPRAVFADVLALRADHEPATSGVGGQDLPADGNPPPPRAGDVVVEHVATPRATPHGVPVVLPQQLESLTLSLPVTAAPPARVPEPPAHRTVAPAPRAVNGDGPPTGRLPIYPSSPAMNIMGAASSTIDKSSTGTAAMTRPNPGDVVTDLVTLRRSSPGPSASSTPLPTRPQMQVEGMSVTATSAMTDDARILHAHRQMSAMTLPVPVATEPVLRQIGASVAKTVVLDPTAKKPANPNPPREVTPLPKMLPVPQIVPSPAPAAAVVAPKWSAVPYPPGGQIQVSAPLLSAPLLSAPLLSASSQLESGMQTTQLTHGIDVPVSDASWSERLSERVLLMASNKLQSAQIRLTPAELGPLRVQIAVDDGAANVTFHAQHAITRDAIEQALPRLRELLADTGLSLNQTNVAEQGDQGVHRDSRDTSDDRRGTPAPERPAEPAGEDKPPHGTRTSLPNSLVDTFA